MKAKIYLVGGAVRDMIMGLNPHDYDFVAVGASEEDFKNWEMVGKDFPVFLDPVHGWEVALARTERKTGNGYGGFTVETKGVSLEDDLSRRDLTINAMAWEVNWSETIREGKPALIGPLNDPFYGRESLKNNELKEVSGAFQEDPLRVLRVCRFLAKWPNFHASTSLIEQMLNCSTELDYLTPERIWLETEKALLCKKPARYFEMLNDLHKTVQFKMFNDLFNLEKAALINDHHQEANAFVHTMMVLESAMDSITLDDKDRIAVGFACLMHDLGKWPTMEATGKMHGHEKDGIPYVQDFCEKYKVPSLYKKVALMTTEYHLKVHNILGRGSNSASKPSSVMKLFERTSALNKPHDFKLMLRACEADHKGRISIETGKPYNQRPYLEECLDAVRAVQTKPISEKMLQEGKSGLIIGEAIRLARLNAIREVQLKWVKHEKTQENINE